MSSPAATEQPPRQVIDEIHGFVTEGIDLEEGRFDAEPTVFWQGLRDLGTELWLDTGDIDEASKHWTAEFSALTTNNTLLNTEVQKGIYDGLISKAARALGELEISTRVVEIAFILNARHGLRLVRRFGGRVSVELHTDRAHDVEATLAYARRFYSICPSHFIIKVPLTPAGLLATRTLRRESIPVNFTLGFSARQNYVAAAFAAPSYVNVFLGRLNSYVKNNRLGDGEGVGERATRSSQRAVKELAEGRPDRTRQIAASLRDGGQPAALAGVDVLTLPTRVAGAAREELDGEWTSSLDVDEPVSLADSVDASAVRLESVWEVSEPVRRFAASLAAQPPGSPGELVDRAHELGAGDLLPRLAEGDLRQIAEDGKIPDHARWAGRIRAGEVAIDTLLNLAGLASFAANQKELDERIRGLAG